MVAPDSHVVPPMLQRDTYNSQAPDMNGLQLEEKSRSALSEEAAPPLGGMSVMIHSAYRSPGPS